MGLLTSRYRHMQHRGVFEEGCNRGICSDFRSKNIYFFHFGVAIIIDLLECRVGILYFTVIGNKDACKKHDRITESIQKNRFQ